MAQQQYKGKIVLPSGGSPVEVTVSATSMDQAKKMIEAQYGSGIKWFSSMNPVYSH